MLIKELAREHEYPGSARYYDRLWVRGEPISSLKEAVRKEIGMLPEVDYTTVSHSCLWLMLKAYNRYFVRLDTCKIKIKGDSSLG
jgi:hypothetical protein